VPVKDRTENSEPECSRSTEKRNDLKLITVSGGEATFPDRDRAVQPEELDALGTMLDETITGGRYDGMSVRTALMEYVLKIRNRNRRVCPFRLGRVQQDIENRAGKRNIVLKARQVGVTTYVAARFFISTITQGGTLSVQVAHDQQSAEEIFRIVHRFLENLPEKWRRSALRTSRANVRQIVLPRLDSEYRVETAADPNAGRGLTIQNLHCSEVARWPRDVEETLASLRAAVPQEGEIFLESTADGAGGTFYEEWQAAPQTGYVRHFYPWWWEPTYRRETDISDFSLDELELIEKHGLDAAQVAFRREMWANFRNRAPEEYAENAIACFLVSGNCIFDCEVLDRKLKQPMDYVSSGDNNRLLRFLPAVPGKEYIVGVDPASGDEHGDNACAQIIDTEKGMQCAELLGHYDPHELAIHILMLAREYNNATLAVERNNTMGGEVLSQLRMDSNYPYVYSAGGKPGWLTSSATRPKMISAMTDILINTPDLLVSKRLLQECRSFIRYRDGNCAAAPGAHDDTIMAMGIAQAVRQEMNGKAAELFHRYGATDKPAKAARPAAVSAH
jgi:hypothetical protein